LANKTLRHTLRHCDILQRTAATHRTCASPFRRSPKHTATHCITPQHTLCIRLICRGAQNRLQHTATHRSCTAHLQSSSCTEVLATHCNTLQHTAIHCNTLQYTATHATHQMNPAHLQKSPQHTATHLNTLKHTGCIYLICRGLGMRMFGCC